MKIYKSEYDRLILNKVNYIEPRRLSYPSITDQLDDIFHNGIDGWKETIQNLSKTSILKKKVIMGELLLDSPKCNPQTY